MNVRELCIYIGNYVINTYFSKTFTFLIISIVVCGFFIMVHYFRNHSLKKDSCRIWALRTLLSMEIATLIVTMLIREPIETTMRWRLQPFASYVMAVEEKSMGMLAQIIMNIIVYIPFGYLLPLCFDAFKKGKRVILVAILCSGLIELIQILSRVGIFEVDDIFNNALGALIGLVIYKLTVFRREKL